MSEKKQNSKPLAEQIFVETIAKLKGQEGFDDTIIENLKMTYSKGEFKKTESIISSIKPKEGE